MLTHIGEYLLSEMMNNYSDVQNFCTSKKTSYQAVPEIKLNKCANLIFDGTHKVDVSLLNHKDKVCIPIELKLGLDCLSKNSFEKRFLSICGTSHQNKRVKGSMIAVMERMLPDTCLNHPLTVTYQDVDFELSKQWILICRKKVIEKWCRKGKPKLSKNCTVIAFEDLVEIMGGKLPFNTMLKNMLVQDYFENWIETGS